MLVTRRARTLGAGGRSSPDLEPGSGRDLDVPPQAGRHTSAKQFHEAVTALRTLTIRRVDEDMEAEAWRWLRRHDERAYSFVDASSFALMRRLRLRAALAFDGDFAAAGFVEARP